MFYVLDFETLHNQDSPDVILCGWLGLKHQLTNCTIKKLFRSYWRHKSTCCHRAHRRCRTYHTLVLPFMTKRSRSSLCNLWFLCADGVALKNTRVCIICLRGKCTMWHLLPLVLLIVCTDNEFVCISSAWQGVPGNLRDDVTSSFMNRPGWSTWRTRWGCERTKERLAGQDEL